MAKLRVLLLCGRSPRHLYVANALCEAADVLAIVRNRNRMVGKNTRKFRPDNIAQTRGAGCAIGGAIGNQEIFLRRSIAATCRPELLREAPHINHRGAAPRARDAADLIAVFGTSLLRGELLNEGRLGIVNLHGGLSPEYRGADCTFWALYNGEPEKIGCTLHYINAGIDTGKLIAHICPAVQADDDELTLFWRGVRESAAAYAELMHRLAQGERFGQPQSHKGRLYQVKDRGLRHEQMVSEIASRYVVPT